MAGLIMQAQCSHAIRTRTDAPDARMQKLLNAFRIQDRWPNLQAAGIRTVFDLAQKSDQDIMRICTLPGATMLKLREVLNKVLAARSSGASAAAPASAANPFGDVRRLPLLSQRAHESTTQLTKCHLPPWRPTLQPVPARPARVLNLAPVPDEQRAAPPRANRPAPGVPNQQPRANRPAPGVPGGQPKANRPAPHVPGSNTRPVSKAHGPSAAKSKIPPRPSRENISDDIRQSALPIVVHQGYATKQGGKVKSWQRRWFILRVDGSLTYAKEGSLTEPKGVIDIKANTELHTPGACNWGKEEGAPATASEQQRFAVVAGDRVYRMFCDTPQEAAVWASKLKQVINMLKRNPNTAPLSSREISSGPGYQHMLASLAAVNGQ
ncbi:uncharacterized protein MONBRDRAFT_8528 [Monosiga brevicollis MX1]|uniref:PH domain-containing protein n=1 Tax=Monosiga brevicollis TaxID=81824 RepID=A9V0A9_MONBE|nr:uncharacterized protein MONBRDRAFT_8528 [Monosiga brevicollis MX1]EDQ88978.1 predicted protein [Monosiga brevicollis MX1]|eukprot:XP_001746083.1 hypothetical protein [Monosiga brevicollis MX1]